MARSTLSAEVEAISKLDYEAWKTAYLKRLKHDYGQVGVGLPAPSEEVLQAQYADRVVEAQEAEEAEKQDEPNQLRR